MKKQLIIRDPEAHFESEIVPSGNGAVAKAQKKYIGKKCLIIITK